MVTISNDLTEPLRFPNHLDQIIMLITDADVRETFIFTFMTEHSKSIKVPSSTVLFRLRCTDTSGKETKFLVLESDTL